MKKLLEFTALLSIAMLIFPLTAVKSEKNTVKTQTPVNAELTIPEKTLNIDTFKVLNDDIITEYSTEDYIFGVVAAEMPALYHEEALKAQSVAAYTFAYIKKQQNAEEDYDITSDHTVDQSFITIDEAKEKWGDKADEYISKIKKAVSDTKGQLITYKNEPITAAYHAISSGTTESCKNVWGSDLPYLKPVSSEWDKLATNYISEATFTSSELIEKLNNLAEIKGEPQKYFNNIKTTDSGTVIEIDLCGKTVSGFKIQKALNLRSACFKVSYSEEKFIFTVYGAGHGVGMSQNGANYMAKQGHNYKDILKYYYTECEIK